ncbi:MAG: hypothetical protein ACYC99_11860 [Candidatus Geothermincolia bacterium]
MFSRKEKPRKKSPSHLEKDDVLTDTEAQTESALKVCPICHKPGEPTETVCSSCGSNLTGGSAWR